MVTRASAGHFRRGRRFYWQARSNPFTVIIHRKLLLRLEKGREGTGEAGNRGKGRRRFRWRESRWRNKLVSRGRAGSEGIFSLLHCRLGQMKLGSILNAYFKKIRKLQFNRYLLNLNCVPSVG